MVEWWLCPPHPAKTPITTVNARTESSRNPRRLALPSGKRQTKSPASASTVRAPFVPGRSGTSSRDVVVAVVLTLSFVVTAPLTGVTVAGEKLHIDSEGNPEHEKLTAVLNPLAGVTVIVVVPDEPAVKVIEAGLAATEKSLCAATAPVAVSDILCGLPLALSAMEMEAVRVPVLVGVKVTLIVQLLPAATIEPQLLVWL